MGLETLGTRGRVQRLLQLTQFKWRLQSREGMDARDLGHLKLARLGWAQEGSGVRDDTGKMLRTGGDMLVGRS